MNPRTLILFLLLCVVWGIPYFFIKLAVVDIAPAGIAWGRITLAAAVLLPLAWHRGVLREAWHHKTAVGAFAIAELVIPFSLIANAERSLTSSITGVLVATVPLSIVLIAPLFGVREPLSARRLGGLGLALAGVIALLGVNRVSGTAQWLGVASLGIAVLGYALGPLIVQRHLRGVDELGATALSLGFASVILLPAALWSRPEVMPSAVPLAAVAVLGLFSTAAALLLYFHVIHAAGAARASVVAYVSPAIAALLGVVVLHERVGWGFLAGLALILVGSYLGSERRL